MTALELTCIYDTRKVAIEQDAADPHFLQKLNQLGPVKVDHHMQTIRPVRF